MADVEQASGTSSESAGKRSRNFFLKQPLNVLLVEDDAVTLQVIERLLRKCDYQVTAARNGREALQILQSEQGSSINLVLTDLLMPEVDGMQLIDALQKEEYQDVPIIVMSSQSSQDAVLKAFEAGARDYLVKPIRKNEVTTLWQHLWRFSQTSGGSSPSAAAPGVGAAAGAAGNQPGAPAADHSAAVSPFAAGPPSTAAASRSGTPQPPAASQPAAAAGPPQRLGVAGTKRPAAVALGSRESASSGPTPSEGGSSSLPVDESADRQQQQQHAPPLEEPQAKRLRQQGAHDVSAPAASVPGQVPEALVNLAIRPLDIGQTPAGGSNPAPMPPALKELAAWGAQMEAERVRLKQQQGAGTDAPGEAPPGSPGLIADLLHHSATRSAFQNFAGIVPRPCDRGDAFAMAQVGSEHPPAAAGPACGHSGDIPPAAAAQALAAPAAAAALLATGLGQQQLLQPPGPAAPPGADAKQQHQRFYQAFTAAVEQHRMTVDKSAANRKDAIARFKEKRKARNFNKTVRYESRRRLAEARPRVKGQFVKAEVAASFNAQQAVEEGGQAAQISQTFGAPQSPSAS